MSSPYLDRLLIAAMKRRTLDTLALKALLKATSLLGLALAQRLREYRAQEDPALTRYARWQEEALHVSLLREALEVLANRWDKLPERQRPHYSPQDRFRILRLKSLLALSADEAARLFKVSPGSVQRWERECQAISGREAIGSLVKPVPPVRRFADVVRHVVQSLSLAGFPGDASVAAFLARAGWKLSRRTVQRIRKEGRGRPLPPPARSSGNQVVRARRANHVWMVDITEVPGLLRLFSFKLAVVLDVFSRAPLAWRAFLCEPDAVAMAQLFRAAVRRSGPPRHVVTDQGAQFTSSRFGATLARDNVRHRFGAIGRAGSIAIIERFFRTLKLTANLHRKPPLLPADLELRLNSAMHYYENLRPHSGLGGATPGEFLTGLRPAHFDAAPPARGRSGEKVQVVVPFGLRYFADRRELPYLVPRAA